MQSKTQNTYRIVTKVSHSLVAFVFTILASNHAIAVQLALDSVPLFVKNSSQSNLILGIDNSGSMEAETLFDTRDGYPWYQTSTASLIDPTTESPFFNAGANTSDYVRYLYLFPNGTGTGARVYTDHYGLPPLPQFAFARSSDFNGMYYNPYKTYEPWYSGGVKTFTNMSPSAAESDPSFTSSTTMNLTGLIENTSNTWKFRIPKNAVAPSDMRYWNGSSWGEHRSGQSIANRTYSSNSDLSISYRPATYYVKTTSGSYSFYDGSATPVLIEGDCSLTPNPEHYEKFEDNPVSDITKALSAVNVHALAYDGSCLTKIEIKLPSSTTYAAGHGEERNDCAADPCTYDEEIQNFANWFSYYRKRHLALRAGMGSAFAGVDSFNAGYFSINNRVDVTMLDLSDTGNKESFYNGIYSVDGNSGGTPNRQALYHAGTQYQRTNAGAPVQNSCQKNFTLFFTDGFTSVDSISSITDYDGTYAYDDPIYDANNDGLINDTDKGLPYKDNSGSNDSLADIALKFYTTPLRTGAGFESGQVPVDSACSPSQSDPSLDCNTDLHMNTFTIGLGAKGSIFGETHFNVADAYIPGNAPVWPATTARDLAQIDDLYHAAVNGRGEIFNAESADDLTDQLSNALVSIQASEGAASSVSFNTSTLESESNVFLALFNPSLWTGDLEAYSLSSTGVVSDEPIWSASDVFTAQPSSYHSTRKMLTYNGTTGVGFQWANLTAAQQDDLNAISCTSCSGQNALNYIRGDQSKEGTSQFRVRESLLGDIINGSPTYVGLPNLRWPAASPFPTAADETYASFKNSQRSASPQRTSVVYVGANDGMLHGFNASTGEEVLAYIPSAIFSTDTDKGLHYLTEVSYQHEYYVDQAPAIADVYIDKDPAASPLDPEWRTVLVGGLGGGGKGIYALDVTDPALFSEANAEDIVLWEFTADDDADLGYTYNKPTISMMANGRWAAIFANGYNSVSEEAKLFIVFLDGGTDGVWTDGSTAGDPVDYVVINTDATTSNGLSSVRVLDTNGNGTADRAYAGDLQGRMWAFDLRDDDGFDPLVGPDKSSKPSWNVAYTQGSNPLPLFTAEDSDNNPQPITTKPSVVFHPTIDGDEPNLLVFFGTGKFIEATDLSSTAGQTFYGVWDTGNDELMRGNLQEQTITTLTDPESNEYRGITNNAVNGSEEGWFIDLPASGERSVVDPTVRGDIVYFNTWIPSSDPCDAGGSGYLMSVAQVNGGWPSTPIFDTNGDGVVDDDDKVSGESPVGQEFQNGLPTSSRFLGNKQYTPGTDSNELSLTGGGIRDVEDLGGGDTGRLSWQELNQ